MSEIIFAGHAGPYAGDKELYQTTEAATRILDAACDAAAQQTGNNAAAILNAPLSLWINHSVRIMGLDTTLAVIAGVADFARHCAARNLQ